MKDLSLIAPLGLAKRIQDREKIILECKRIMEDIYSPAVAGFMLELAISRGRLQQLREIMGMALKADDIRRIIMNKIYISPNLLVNLMGQDMTKFVWEIPFRQYGRLDIIWRNFWYRLRNFYHEISRR